MVLLGQMIGESGREALAKVRENAEREAMWRAAERQRETERRKARQRKARLREAFGTGASSSN